MKWLHLNTNINPTDYGWEEQDGQLFLKKLSHGDKLIPGDLLKKVSCKCKKNCSTRSCSCVKNGLKCSEYCKHCMGKNCKNCNLELTSEDMNINSIYEEKEVQTEGENNEIDEANTTLEDLIQKYTNV